MSENKKCAYCGAETNGMLFCPECKRKHPLTTRENQTHPAELHGIPDMKKFFNSLVIDDEDF